MMLAFDLETRLIRRPVAAPRPVCIQWCDRPPAHALDAKLELYDPERTRELLEAPGIKVGHNVAYDFSCAMARDASIIELVFDLYARDRVQCTLLNQKLIDIARGELKFRKSRGYDLGEVARRYDIVVDKSDPWKLKYAQLENIKPEDWPEDARNYALQDATATYRIAEAQQAVSAEWEAQYGSPILHTAGARARYGLVLYLAQIYGVRTNQARCDLLERVTVAEIARMKELLLAEGLVRKNGSKDTKAAKARVEAVFKGKGLEVPKTEDKRKKLTDDESDEEDYVPGISTEKDTMILSGDETLILYSEYTSANNILNRTNDLKKGVRWPLQPRYDSLLETGRTSSSKGGRKGKTEEGQLEGIQIQNFPRSLTETAKHALIQLGLAEVKGYDRAGKPMIKTFVGCRETLEPRPGNVYVLADYSSAELHSLAQTHIDLFGRSHLAEILNNKDDVHLMVGIEAYSGGQYVYNKELKKLKDELPFADWRQSGKPIVFGRPGGMGARKIVVTARKSYGVTLTVMEAEHIIGVYETLVPELPEQFEFVASCLSGKRGLMRQLRSGRWRGGATFCQMNNTYFQGLTADGALEALFAVARECYAVPSSPLYGFRIVAFVHDEIVLEGPRERAHEAAMRLQLVMEREMNVFHPDCPTPAEPVITEVWSKQAKAVWKDGELIPWTIPEMRRAA
jgi:DNA polymerase-1